ncbi:hypothetical protein [Streptomyces sp. NPDC058625]|uniref:hypothetical protein n=1 Tax=Streptomyces sp. NPDC058625 TaxID=3346564 RepID=UPI0036462EC4
MRAEHDPGPAYINSLAGSGYVTKSSSEVSDENFEEFAHDDYLAMRLCRLAL